MTWLEDGGNVGIFIESSECGVRSSVLRPDIHHHLHHAAWRLHCHNYRLGFAQLAAICWPISINNAPDSRPTPGSRLHSLCPFAARVVWLMMPWQCRATRRSHNSAGATKCICGYLLAVVFFFFGPPSFTDCCCWKMESFSCLMRQLDGLPFTTWHSGHAADELHMAQIKRLQLPAAEISIIAPYDYQSL